MNRRAVLVSGAVLLVLAAAAQAQSNELIDRLLEERQATFGKAAALALAAAGIVPAEATEAQALEALGRQGWKVRVRQAEEPVRLGEYAFLLMKAFGIPGGVMYSILPGPRYAARELAYLQLVRGDASPGRLLSGEEVMRILGSVLSYQEARS